MGAELYKHLTQYFAKHLEEVRQVRLQRLSLCSVELVGPDGVPFIPSLGQLP
jgi:hypothetical protein